MQLQQTLLLPTLAVLLISLALSTALPDDEDRYQPVALDQMVSVGRTVILTCTVTETDNYSLSWRNKAQQTMYFGDKKALRDSRIQLHNSTPTELSISISDVQLSDEGEYTCSIFTTPVRMARATLTVLGVPGKPVISGYQEQVQEGASVTLKCTSSGSKPPAKLRWYRGDQELIGRPDIVESDPGAPTYTVISELLVTASRQDNHQPIVCEVEHVSIGEGEEKKRTESYLDVLYSPSVRIQPSSDLPREGEKFHLECISDGNPAPSSFVWEKKDADLPALAKSNNSYLRFEALNKSDAGVYLCTANNDVGQEQSQYTLLVQGVQGGCEVGLPAQNLDFEKKKQQTQTETQALLQIEREKLALYRERLEIEKERLALEREKFEWEKKKHSEL
ncbi:cell adhesion molecule 3-like [Engraulis encrasicolus]|uniref:cell adhesion molecule 3-like n=1 Tax=Engraulis encrasicolus TaxID=184585 RepID=UPI002FD6A9A3